MVEDSVERPIDVKLHEEEPTVTEATAPAPPADAGEKEDDSLDKEKDSFKKPPHQSPALTFPMREVVIPIGKSEIRFNPFASIFAIIFLWGISIWCMVSPEAAADTLGEWRGILTELFTWFYIGTNPAFMVRIYSMVYITGTCLEPLYPSTHNNVLLLFLLLDVYLL
jgi:hypothetical protein